MTDHFRKKSGKKMSFLQKTYNAGGGEKVNGEAGTVSMYSRFMKEDTEMKGRVRNFKGLD